MKDELYKKAEKLSLEVIDTDPEPAGYVERLIENAGILKSAEQTRKEITKPFLAQKREVDDTFKTLTAGLKKYDSMLRKRFLTKVKAAFMQPENIPDTFNTSAGAVWIRKDEKVVIVDEKAIPDEYRMVDTKKVEKAVRAGVRVPGAEITTKETVVVTPGRKR